MNRRALLPLLAAVLVAGCSSFPSLPLGSSASASPSAIEASLADSRRPEADRTRDARSRPAEILAFAGVKPGQRVADLVIGGGYYTRVFAGTVGPKGHVWAWQPAEFVKFDAKYGEALKTLPAAYPNVTGLDAALGALVLPEKLDLAFTNQNYHDFHLKPFAGDTAARVNAAVFKALKPGGVYLIIDHHALAGADVTQTATGLHRMDVEAVKREVMAAGFVLDGESQLLRNPADPRTAIVFDPSIQGHTDQYILKFRKPKR
jgi:predicted methyltransferase